MMNAFQTISKREQTLVAVTIAVVVIGLLYAFVVEPLARTYTQMNQEIQTKQMQLIKKLRLMRQKDTVAAEFEQYGDELRLKQTDEEEMAAVLGELERLGKAAGIYFSNVKPQRVRDMNFYKELTVEVKFSGTLPALTKFVYSLKTSPLLLKVKRLFLTLEGNSPADIEGTLQISKVALM